MGVIFKTNSYNYYNHYALIKVRAPLKIIKKKIKTLNKYDEYDTINIFKRTEYISEDDMANANNVLYVNNFDIIKGNTHKMFTNLFLRFGELVKDIKMGLVNILCVFPFIISKLFTYNTLFAFAISSSEIYFVLSNILIVLYSSYLFNVFIFFLIIFNGALTLINA